MRGRADQEDDASLSGACTEENLLFQLWGKLPPSSNHASKPSIEKTFHTPHTKIRMFFSYFSSHKRRVADAYPPRIIRAWDQTWEYLNLSQFQRSHITSPNLQKSQGSPPLYFSKMSAWCLPVFENWQAPFWSFPRIHRPLHPTCEAVLEPFHFQFKNFQKCQVPWAILTQSKAAQSWQREQHLQIFTAICFREMDRLLLF